MKSLTKICIVLLMSVQAIYSQEVSQKKFLQKYSGESTEQLLALSSEYRIDSIVLAFEQAIEGKKLKGKLSKQEQYILVIEAFEREINNGGYLQFFENSSSKYTGLLVEALTAIKCVEISKLSQRAISLLDVDGVITEAKIEASIESKGDDLTGALDKLDKEFYKTTESIETKLFEYIKTNLKSINL